jgi:hypothetical protein
MTERAGWATYRAEVFGDPYVVWHEGPEFGELISRARTDPEAVAAALRLGLAAGDPVAAAGYAALVRAGAAVPGAEGVLRGVLPTATGTFRVRLATSLLSITGDQAWAGEILPVLRDASAWGHRLDAAVALAGFAPTTDLADALAVAVATDEAYLVRYHAADTLRTFAGRRTGVSGNRSLLDRISAPRTGDPGPADRAGWAEAARVLRVAVRV